jgi:adenine-specific DNA-methyltransferase
MFEKMKMKSPDIVSENMAYIARRWPECLTEAKDENGKLRPVIDFDKLRQLLSSDATGEEQERYQFTWPDKRHAIRLANTPTTSTLRPCRADSVDFDNTRNLYIEGDNLDVLKLLRESYLGKVKMIYIDPPYNTGGDFVYKDNFVKKNSDYTEVSGAYDEEGNQVVEEFEKNVDSNGRFHTDWLNMIYPRLKVARDLLTEDGVIFISIDDNELKNLKNVCDEVFGEKNFIGQWNWFKSATPPNLSKKIKKNIEYILAYQKGNNSNTFTGTMKTSSSDDPITKPQNTIKDLTFEPGWIHAKFDDGVVKAGVYGTAKFPNILLNDLIIENGVNKNEVTFRNKFIWIQDTLKTQIEKGTRINLSKALVISYKKAEYSAEVPPNLIDDSVGVGTTEAAGTALDELFNNQTIFDYPKPVALMRYLIGFDTPKKDAIVLDFFSGSASTAQSVMELNAMDDGNRKFILVQYPENLDENQKRLTGNAKQTTENAISFLQSINKSHYLSEIGKERIRRAGKKIKEEHPDWNGDTGFRVLKLDSSNMENVYYTPAETTEQTLFADNIKPDRTDEDLLFQVMMELGIALSDKIEKTVIAGKTVWNVGQGYLMACFERDVTEDTITAIAKQQPQYFVIADRSLASDNVADNFEQLFEEYSPTTIRRIL